MGSKTKEAIVSTLLFVTVLILLAVINAREARQERKLAAEQRR